MSEKMGAISSTGCQKRWEMDRKDVEARVWQCQEPMCRILLDKLKVKDILVITFVVNDMFNIIAQAFEPTFEVMTVMYADWDTFKEPETKKQICYMGWWDSQPFRKMIDDGRMGKKSIIISGAKDKDFKFFYENRYTIDTFMNCEGDLGFKFPKCDKFHTIIHTPMDVVDENVTFDKKVDNCACGYKGATFSFEAKK